MKLYGSTTSPYVRRLRIFLADKAYEFVNMNIFGPEDRATLKAINPTLKIPMLEDGGKVIFDSNIIHRYLLEKLGLAPLSWDQQNQLTLINAANDSMIELLLCERSNLDTKSDVMFFKLQRERMAEIFSELNRQCEAGLFAHWNYPAISLYCLLDWAAFRHLYDFSAHSALVKQYEASKAQAFVAESDPRI